MKQYTKLPIPVDTAWDGSRYRLEGYIHWRIREFFTSVKNLIVWLPTIWKDRHWDDFYITKILQRKIELQRAYLVSANRHLNIDRDNYWMTVVLNLIERKHEQYYVMEPYEFITIGKDVFGHIESENLNEYIAKYPAAKRAAIKKYAKNNKSLNDKENIAFFMGHVRQQKCDDLIFEILKKHSSEWWD